MADQTIVIDLDESAETLLLPGRWPSKYALLAQGYQCLFDKQWDVTLHHGKSLEEIFDIPSVRRKDSHRRIVVNYFERYLGKDDVQVLVFPRILCNQTNCNSRELFDLIANISTKFIEGRLMSPPTQGHLLNKASSSTERSITAPHRTSLTTKISTTTANDESSAMEISQPTLSVTSPSTEVYATSSNLILPPTETPQATRNDESTHTERYTAVSDHADQSPETHTRPSNHESSFLPTPKQPFQENDPLKDTAFQTSNHAYPRMRRTNLLLLVVITSIVEYLLRCN